MTLNLNPEYASKGVAGAGLGTGIAGLSLGVINSLGGLAGLFGGARNTGSATVANDALTAMMAAGLLRGGSFGGCGAGSEPVTQKEMELTQKLAEKDMVIALRDAEKHTDAKNLEMYQYIDGRLKEITAVLGEQAVKNQANKDSFMMLQQQMAADKAEVLGAIACERKERKAADDIIVNYANSTFYSEMIAGVTTGDTTTAAQKYNPLPACTCNC